MQKNCFIVIFSGIFLIPVYSVRVCDTLLHYITSKNCHDDPLPNLNISEIIRKWGYEAKEYKLVTSDGYELLLVHGRSGSSDRTPVILGHGINMNSLGWVMINNKSLAYRILKMGYDIWLPNYRGTIYSQKHSNLTTSQREYWQFSFDQMGQIDMPLLIDFIYKQAKKPAIYIGYSMGTTIGFVYTSTRPKEAQERLKGFIGLAPVPGGYLRSPVVLVTPLYPILRIFLKVFLGGRVPRSKNSGLFCSKFPFMILCEFIRWVVVGFDPGELDPLTLPTTSLMNPDTISGDVLVHYSQLVLSKKFQNFDYGPRKNFEIYRKKTPPEYPLSDISVPVSLFVGKNDWIATVEGSQIAYSELNKSIKCGLYFNHYKYFNHYDFIYAREVVTLLYEDVEKKLVDIDKGNCQE